MSFEWLLPVGWWMLAVFVALGLMLEGSHAFKVGSHLGVKQETRWLMWTLAHAHLTLLGVLNLCFAQALIAFKHWNGRTRRIASTAFLWSALLLPTAFLSWRSGRPRRRSGSGLLLVPARGHPVVGSGVAHGRGRGHAAASRTSRPQGQLT